MHITDSRSVISLIISLLITIAAILYRDDLSVMSIFFIAALVIWLIVSSIPVSTKMDGELQINNEKDKDTYRIVLYDDPDNFKDKEYLKFYVVDPRKKHR